MATGYSDTKRALLERYLRNEVGAYRAGSSIPRRNPNETIPLSYAQEQVWVHAQLAPHLPLYNEPVTIHYSGFLNAEALERSFNEILRRHETWRTSFGIVEGEPAQNVHDHLTVRLPLIDLTELPEKKREIRAIEIAKADACETFDLGRVPLFRAKLIRLQQQKYRLYLTLCHLIFDGVALDRVFLPELASLYKHFAVGDPNSLPELAVQYPDYACWERRTLTSEKQSKEIAYWSNHLSGHLPERYLPSDHRPPRVRSFRGSMYRFRLRPPLLKRTKEFCRREGVSLFHVMFATFAALLQRYSGEGRLPVGIVTARRKHPDAEPLLGYFLNTVVVPTDTSGDPSFRALVQRARDWSIEAMDHDQMPFEHLLRELKIRRESNRNPLFQALFSMEALSAIDSTWRLTQMDVDTGTTKYDLYLKLDDQGDEMLVRIHYSTDLFERHTIGRMALHWKSLLKDGLAYPDRRLSEAELLTTRERRSHLRSCQGPTYQHPKVGIHELFQQQVEHTPDAIAVTSRAGDLSYRDLNNRANQLAQLLLRHGVRQEDRVGVCVDRGLHMVVALLGILKAGAAYVPLDSRLPDERLKFLLGDSKPVLVITDNRSSRREFGLTAVVLDESFESVKKETSTNPQISIAPNNLAYLIYTSGSTGTPKGVAVEHGSVVNLLTSMQHELGISCSDVLLAVTTLSFDIAGLEIFLPLIAGARLVLADASDAMDGVRLKQLLKDSKPTLMQATPATWRLLLEAGWEGDPNTKILCGGEALSAALAKELLTRTRSVWNVYGPTETTIWSSAYRLNGQEEDSIPIGYPIANTGIYILDHAGNLVPDNVSGEIYIGGAGLAREYWNRPELTAERFVEKSLTPSHSERLYRTGDLGCRRSDGQINYFGRIDTQVKLRGMRIELGEIESVLGSHPDVQQAVVTLSGEHENGKIAAYLVLKSGIRSLNARELRRHARSRLPESMIPAQFSVIDTVPLLVSGKIDRAALANVEKMLLKEADSWVAPRNRVEARLATIWSELLKLEKIGVDQNFFELGGHSLLVLQMTARIRRCLNVEIPARLVFESPTIASLAEHVEKASDFSSTLRPSTKVPVVNTPLSPWD